MFKYRLVPYEPLEIKTHIENNSLEESIDCVTINSALVTKDVWAFESFKLLKLINELNQTHGSLGDFKGLSIKDGVQALWKKAYHITDYSISDNFLIGKNGFGEEVKIELAMTRPVIYNDLFYCFKKLEPHAYTLFPYRDNNKTPVLISEIKTEFPYTYEYLLSIEERLKNKVDHVDNPELWHKFTREHNHETYSENKIILPMTAKDTIATCAINQALYMDNSNVWFIKIDNHDVKILKAVCAVINSTVFSVLARAKANPQSGGYYKLNKQFLLPVPFPSERLISSPNIVDNLLKVSDDIEKLQDTYLKAIPSNRDVIKGTLSKKWTELDSICNDLYNLSNEQAKLVAEEARTVNRIELLKGMI